MRYVVFTGDTYYPIGGWYDNHSIFSTLEEAKEYIKQFTSKADWWHLVDLQTGIVLEEG